MKELITIVIASLAVVTWMILLGSTVDAWRDK